MLRNHFDFFFIFPLFVVYSSIFPCQITFGLIIEISSNIQVEPLARVAVPLYYIVRVSPSCPASLTANFWFRSVGLPTLSKTIKSRLNALGARHLPFSLSLILPGRRRTLNTRTRAAGVARRVLRRATRSAVSLQLRAILV